MSYGIMLMEILIPFGSVDSMPRALGAIIAVMITTLSIVIFGEPPLTKSVFRVALLIMAALVGAACLQTVPLPFTALRAEIWGQLGSFGLPAMNTISVSPADTWAAMIPLALPFLVFIGGLILYPDDISAMRLLRFVAFSGGIISVYGVLQHVVDPKTVLFTSKLYYLDSATGVFINRNTAATYFGMISLLLFSLIWQSHELKTKFRPPSGTGTTFDESQIVWGVFLCISLIGLFLTKSRGGIACTFIGFAVICVLMTRISQRARASVPDDVERIWLWRQRMAQLALTFTVIVGGALVFGGRALLRAEAQGIEDGRFCVWPGVVQAIKEHWLIGTGFGAFQETFPAYRDPHCGLEFMWDRAHNGLLEGTLGLGILFPIAFLAGAAVLGMCFRRGVRERKALRMMPIAGYGIFVLVVTHSMVDFSMQIPGFAAVTSAVFAATVTLSLGRKKVSRNKA